MDVSVVMPCLNEEKSVGWCVERAWRGIERTGLSGELVVCDNGSVDRSVEVAEQAGARVVHQSMRGYGLAYLTGIEASVGRIIVIGDSDCSYDFLEIDALIGPLLDGYDYVLGSRLAGTILPGAMPFLNRHLGNPVLTGVLNRLFGLDTTDAHSGLRAFTRSAYRRMRLRCEGMEFASEIVIAAARTGLRVTEVPITYHPRVGESKLNRWRDGARHLRFMFGEALSPSPRGTLEAGHAEAEHAEADLAATAAPPPSPASSVSNGWSANGANGAGGVESGARTNGQPVPYPEQTRQVPAVRGGVRTRAPAGLAEGRMGAGPSGRPPSDGM